jgi:hypothetical protein
VLRSVISAFQLHFNQPAQPGPGLQQGSAPWPVASIKIASLTAPPFNLSLASSDRKDREGSTLEYYRYKGHSFSIDSHPLPDRESWTFVAVVHWVESDQEEFTTYDHDHRFTSPNEAQMEGIAVIRKWIDDGKPRSK